MRSFDYKEEWKKLLTPEIVMYLTQIHEFKGEQTLFIEAKADTLSQLVDIAKIQSIEASNKIEGIYTSDERLKALVKDSTRPRTRNEREIESSPNLCVNSSFSYVVLSTLLLSSRDLTEWSLVYHSTLSYQRFYDLHSIHYDHLEGLHQLI